MKRTSLLFILASSLLVAAGCDRFEAREGLQKAPSPKVSDHDKAGLAPALPDEAGPTHPYQVGTSWDRQLVEPEPHHPFQVFMMNRTGLGDVGVGVYLGRTTSGRAIVMTAAHLFPDLEDCAIEVSFVIETKDSFSYFPCSGWSYKLKDNDIMLFEVSAKAPVDLLIPLEVSDQSIYKHQPLTLWSVRRDYLAETVEWHKDQSKECMGLSAVAKRTTDPDTVNPAEASWSVAMGCDGMHGDSGSPILDDQGQLLGLLWTGKFPKGNGSQDAYTTDEEKIWSQFNYYVPVEKIREELAALQEGTTVINSADKEVLSEILTEFF